MRSGTGGGKQACEGRQAIGCNIVRARGRITDPAQSVCVSACRGQTIDFGDTALPCSCNSTRSPGDSKKLFPRLDADRKGPCSETDIPRACSHPPRRWVFCLYRKSHRTRACLRPDAHPGDVESLHREEQRPSFDKKRGEPPRSPWFLRIALGKGANGRTVRRAAAGKP